MSTTLKCSSFVIDGEHVAQQVIDIRAKLGGPKAPKCCSTSSLRRRLDPAGIQALEELAGAADIENAKIVLRGVNIEMYKVLKLAGLSDKFTFID